MHRGLIIALFIAFAWLVGCTGGDLPSAPSGDQTAPSATATPKITPRPTVSPTYSWDWP